MLSSFACAVPGIMATRVIPERRDRLATILAAPFMTCSARLPVYALLIGAFVPDRHFLGGTVNLQGLSCWPVHARHPRRRPDGAAAEAHRAPRADADLHDRAAALPAAQLALDAAQAAGARPGVRRPGRHGDLLGGHRHLGAGLFPPPGRDRRHLRRRARVDREQHAVPRRTRRTPVGARLGEASAYLEQSWLGRLGHFVAPAFAPLGWDWKLSAAVIASFPAREIVVASLGTIYSVGDQGDERKTRSGNGCGQPPSRTARWCSRCRMAMGC